jgi:CubicO group peptidase (beta-lactamase class C family)
MMREALSPYVERGIVPGLIALVSRGADDDTLVLGSKADGASDPMRRDTIFRISSMTKPVAAAAAMILVEEKKLTLDEPVDRLLPELAGRRVLLRVDGPLDDTVPAARPITVRDLLTFRMGFGIVWGPPDATPIQRAAAELHLGAFGPPKPEEPPPPDEWIRRFATLPLMHQPGQRWMYNTGAEVLGVLLARASDRSLDVLLRERIFDPLGMKDTAFHVPASKLHRFLPATMARDPFHPDRPGSDPYDPVDGQWARPPAFPSAGAGLVSTADDYLAFGRLMLGRGTLGGTRILSAASVDAMTSDQLTPEQKAISEMQPPGYWEDHGWGFGMAVVTGPDDLAGRAGRYGWDGGLGTSWCSDPTQDLVGVLMTQRSAFPAMSGVYRAFWRAVYGRSVRSG